ncbi:coproporphyrinogen III oxidase, partial [Rothia kristinae]
AAQIRRGELSPVDDDAQADMYLLADRLFGEAGYSWYEVSNWSRSEDTRSRHNLAYWRNRDWWGIGPGAHSHINGVRWWNLKHPVPYAHRVRQGLSPAAAREHLDADTRYVEDVMLAARIREGVAIEDLRGPGREAVGWLEGQGLIEPQARAEGRVVLTLRGRLLGDAVVRTLLGD